MREDRKKRPFARFEKRFQLRRTALSVIPILGTFTAADLADRRFFYRENLRTIWYLIHRWFHSHSIRADRMILHFSIQWVRHCYRKYLFCVIPRKLVNISRLVDWWVSVVVVLDRRRHWQGCLLHLESNERLRNSQGPFLSCQNPQCLFAYIRIMCTYRCIICIIL